MSRISGQLAAWLRRGSAAALQDVSTLKSDNKSLWRRDFPSPGASCPHSPFRPLQGSEALLYAPRRGLGFALFLGSSAVEHSTVNRMVAGSNPARGANQIKRLAQKFYFRPWRHVCTVSANPAAPALTVLTNSKPSSLTRRRLSLGPRAFTRCRDNQGWRGQQASARETLGRSPRFAR